MNRVFSCNQVRTFKLTNQTCKSVNYLATAMVAHKTTLKELVESKKVPKLILRNAIILYCNLKSVKVPPKLSEKFRIVKN